MMQHYHRESQQRKYRYGGKRPFAAIPILSLLALSVYLIASLLAACSNTPSNLARPSLMSGPYNTTPFPRNVDHGTLVFADSQFPDSVNPLFGGSSVDIAVETALWARPVFYDQQFHVHPDQLTEVPLPENGDVLDGGKTIIMHLRHDLRWSDGQPIVASDFQYWWRLIKTRIPAHYSRAAMI